MKMPALMTPKNAVTASNMAKILKPSDWTYGMGLCTGKRILLNVETSERVDVLMQHAAQPAINHSVFRRDV
jgi:hypothetical protein